MKYRNNKSGMSYVLVGYATDTSEHGQGRDVAVYHRAGYPGILFVREKDEFHRKFTEMS